MTESHTSPPTPGTSCSTRSAASTRRSSRATARSPDDRHVADGYRMLATTLGRRLRHLPVRRAEPAGLRGGQHAVPARPALGRRQHRRLLLPRARSTPRAATGSPATAATRLLLGHRLQRALARCVVGPDRAASCTTTTWTIDADGNFSFEIRPDARPRGGADHPRLPGRPADRPPGHLADRGARRAGPDPPRRRRDRGCACGASAAWLRTMFAIIPLDRRRPQPTTSTRSATRSRKPPTRVRRPIPGAGRQLRLVGPRRVLLLRQSSTSPRTRRWSSPTGRRRAGSGICACGTSSWPPTAPATAAARSTAPPPCPTPTAPSPSWSASGLTSHPNALTTLDYPARQPRVPLVPRRRGSGSPRGEAGEALRRADGRVVTEQKAR